MPLILFPGTDQYTAITVSGLYDNNTESPLFAASGTTVPTSGIAIGGQDATGLFQLLSQDQSANALTFPGIQFKIGAVWNATTTAGTFQYNTGTATPLATMSGAPAYVIQLDQSAGTFTTGAVTFEGTYDNVNWVPIATSQILDPSTFASQPNPYTFVTATNKAFLILSQGFVQIRLELTTALTGGDTGTVTPYWSTLAYEPAIASSNSSTVSGTLSNNTAAPVADNVGVLPALAATTYTTNTYTNGFQVLPVTDLHGASNTDMQAVAGIQLGATAVTAFGTPPAAANVQGVNASIYQGTAAISTANPLFTNISDGTNALTANAITAWGTPATGHVLGVNAEMFAGNTALTATGSSLNVNITNATPITVAGNLSNNTAAPTADNVGTLGYVATATPEAYTQGNQVLATTSLGGAVRVVPVDEANASSLSYYSVDDGNAFVANLVNNVITPLVSVRSSSAAFIYIVRSLSTFTDGSQVLFRLYKNPTLTGATFAATPPTGSHVTFDTAATAVTAGQVVWSGYVAATPRDQDQLLYALAGGTPGDVYTLAAEKFGAGTAKAAGALQWSEQAAAL
jgi:hypothetical protein